MSTEVLQEFLVKLGYKIDSASANRFSNSLSKMNKGVLGVGVAVAGMAFLAQKAMRDYASEMEDLKYTSQLASSSANSINNMSRAMQQFGFKPGQIEGIVQGFAGMIAASPGLEAMMKSMGVGLNPDKAIEFFNVMRKLEAMPEPVAIRTAAEFGVDIQSYRLIRGHIGEMSAEWQKVDAANKKVGNNLDEQIKQGREFNNVLRDIGNQIDAISNKIMGLSIEKFGMKWVKSMREELETVMGALGGSNIEKGKLAAQAKEAVSIAGPAGAGTNVLFDEMLKMMVTMSQLTGGGKTMPVVEAGKISEATTSSKLGTTVNDNSTTITNHNTFHIQGTDAKTNANEVSKKLSGSSFNEKKVAARNQLGGNS